MSNAMPRSSFDDFLREEGTYEEATAAAIERVIVWQIEQRRIPCRLSKTAPATRMGTTRSHVDRFMNPEHSNVEPVTFQRAAAVGSELRVKLVK